MSDVDFEFTAFFPFGGSGGSALGTQRAEVHLFGKRARFRVLGGIDISQSACDNFKLLTGVEQACADVAKLTVEDLWRLVGRKAPDFVFCTAPCKGSSKLISSEKAAEPYYEALNQLALRWTRLMLAAWKPGPGLICFENVPNITVRAKPMLDELRGLLGGGEYLIHDGAHELGEMATVGGRYDAGELGGLAQRRKRWLFLARDPKQCPAFLYQTPKRRVRGVGEVIGPLPMPGDPAGGPMHVLPRISVLNLIRLALIPAGGDHRDLPGALEAHQQRRAVFRRMHVVGWDESSVTVGGPGTNGPYGVADARIRCTPRAGAYGGLAFDESSKAVLGSACLDNSPVSVADTRVVPQARNACMHDGKYKVRPFEGHAGAVTGAGRVGSGAQSVADPRVCFGNVDRVTDWGSSVGCATASPAPSSGAGAAADPRAWFRGVLGVVPWCTSTGVITGNARPCSGAFSVADIRVKSAFDRGYAVVHWGCASNAVASTSAVGCGTYSVADPRPTCNVPGAPGIITIDEALNFLEGPGPWAIVDPASDGPPLAIITDLRKPPPFPLVIISSDGTWHRPLTSLELFVIQGGPAQVDGKPTVLFGSGSTEWREHIGNMVPPPAAQAIAEQVLITLLSAATGAFTLSSGGDVWVTPAELAACGGLQ